MKDYLTISYLHFWNQSGKDAQNMWFSKFIEKNICKIEHIEPNENPDILICSYKGSIKKVKKIRAKAKLFFYGENLNKYPHYNDIKLLQKVFDLIVGFKYEDIDNKIIRFPLWLIYYPFYNMEDRENNIISYIENRYKKNIMEDKPIFGSLVATHDRGGQRKILLDELQKYGDVKCPSSFNKNCKGIGYGSKAKIEFIKKSKYNICPENSIFEGYFSEKIFQAFEGGNIPIYWAVDRPEKDILNENKYCFVNVNDKNDVYEKIKDVVDNYDKYKEGNVFKPQAKNTVDNYYKTLVNKIKSLLPGNLIKEPQ